MTDLSDTELVNEAADSDASGDENTGNRGIGSGAAPHPVQVATRTPTPAVVTARAVRSATPSGPAERRSVRPTQGTDMIRQIARSFDPEVQRLRDEERGNRMAENTQLLAMSQQLRDFQAQTEAVRRELSAVQERLQEAERSKDLAEMRLEIERSVRPSGIRGRDRSRSHSRSHRSRSDSRHSYRRSHHHSHHSASRRHAKRSRSRDGFGRFVHPQLGEDTPFTAVVKQPDGRLKIKRKSETVFREGGGHIDWVTDGSPYTPGSRPHKRRRRRSPTPYAGSSRMRSLTPPDQLESREDFVVSVTPARAPRISFLVHGTSPQPLEDAKARDDRADCEEAGHST